MHSIVGARIDRFAVDVRTGVSNAGDRRRDSAVDEGLLAPADEGDAGRVAHEEPSMSRRVAKPRLPSPLLTMAMSPD